MKDIDVTQKGPVLYRAPYVVPVTGPLIEDGGVLVNAGRIVAVDRFQRLRHDAWQLVTLDQRIITPALINCHAHLELSHLADFGREVVIAAGDITAWIRALLAKRSEVVPIEAIILAGRQALARLYLRGVALVCDIGNEAASLAISDGSAAECLFFRELLGVTEQAAAQAILVASEQSQGAALATGAGWTAHAPYSCHPSLLKALKGQARQSGRLFPIHVAESADEIEFLQKASGPFRQFLAERLRLAGALSEGQELQELVTIPGCGAVKYLHELNLLDSRTICVHTVHISASEADLLAKTKAKVCLCPGSNRRLGVGKAPVSMLSQRRILPGLGTDSLASNLGLDLWTEMQVLQEDHPALSPELIFSMATQGGAKTLGVSQRLGGLAPGLEAKLLAIDFRGSVSDIYPFLVNTGKAITLDWLEAGNVS